MSDPKLGLSRRLITHYNPADDTWPNRTTADVALQLAMSDERDIPMLEKLRDAQDFLASRGQ